MLKIKTLEQAEILDEPTTQKMAWSTGQRLIFIGVVVIHISMAYGCWLYFFRAPTDPYANFTPDQMRNMAQNLTPVGNWILWHRLEQGGLDKRKRGAEIFYEEQKTKYQIYWVILASIAGTGLAMIAAGIVVVELKKKKRKPKIDTRKLATDNRQ
jgi:hypothetical protein